MPARKKKKDKNRLEKRTNGETEQDKLSQCRNYKKQ